jgi:hypothetical protein
VATNLDLDPDLIDRDVPEVGALERALAGGDLVVTTGLVHQEILQGFRGPRHQQAVVARFAAFPS